MKDLLDRLSEIDEITEFQNTLKRYGNNSKWLKNGKPIKGILAKLIGNIVKDGMKKRKAIVMEDAGLKGKELKLNKLPSIEERKRQMKELLLKKFSKNPYKKILLDTGNKLLHERSMRGLDGGIWTFNSKRNDDETDLLGKLLMEVREEIKTKEGGSLKKIDEIKDENLDKKSNYLVSILKNNGDISKLKRTIKKKIKWNNIDSLGNDLKDIDFSLSDKLDNIDLDNMRIDVFDEDSGKILNKNADLVGMNNIDVENNMILNDDKENLNNLDIKEINLKIVENNNKNINEIDSIDELMVNINDKERNKKKNVYFSDLEIGNEQLNKEDENLIDFSGLAVNNGMENDVNNESNINSDIKIIKIS